MFVGRNHFFFQSELVQPCKVTEIAQRVSYCMQFFLMNIGDCDLLGIGVEVSCSNYKELLLLALLLLVLVKTRATIIEVAVFV